MFGWLDSEIIAALGDLCRLGLEKGEGKRISVENNHQWRISALSFGRDGVKEDF